MRWLFLLLLLAAHAACADTLSGRVVAVQDGDTLTLMDASRQRHKIRLADIAAPEPGQPFYLRSSKSLASICFRKPASATTQGKDRHGHHLGKVKCNDVDASAEQVRRGFAWTAKEYVPMTSALYELEAYARLRQLGVWSQAK